MSSRSSSLASKLRAPFPASRCVRRPLQRAPLPHYIFYRPWRACAPCQSGGLARSISERISSRLMVSMSRIGSMLPSTWTIFGSSKQRTTWTMASTWRMWERNLLPSPSPLDAPRDQARDVHELHDRRRHLLADDICLPARSNRSSGTGYHAHIGVNGAEGIVSGFRARVGDCVEQRALAHVRQAYNSQFHQNELLYVFGIREENYIAKAPGVQAILQEGTARWDFLWIGTPW